MLPRTSSVIVVARRATWRPGDVWAVEFDEAIGYGKMLRSPMMTFFDSFTEQSQRMRQSNELATAKVLFRIAVERAAFKSDRFHPIGKLPFTDEEAVEEYRSFRKDVFSGAYFIHVSGADSWRDEPGTEADCQDLERMSVYSEFNVRDRLADYYRLGPEVAWQDWRTK